MKLTPSAHVDTFCRDHLPPAEQWPDLEFTRPELAYPDRLNCASALLDETIAAYGADRPCLLPQDPDAQVWSYADLARVASQIAHVLTNDLGVVPGNRVLLRGPNNPWLVACWFGVLLAGGVAVATMPLLRAGELTTICDIAQVTLALCDDRFTDELEAAEVPGLRTVSFHSAAPAVQAAWADAGAQGNLNALASRKPGTFDAVQTAVDDVALIAFTSGTTGRPKAAMHFHRDVLAVADTFSARVLKPTKDDIFTGTPPLAFTFGLGAILIFPIRAGASTLLIERATPGELADHIAARGVTVVSTAPTAYRAMLAAGKAEQLRDLRRPVSAGETLPGSVWQAFYDATGVKIIDGIGSTEMLHIFISAADDQIKPGSTGLPVPGYRAAILDAAGQPVPDGQPGRLAVKGPTGCRYLADERQRNYVGNGWNFTGDTYIRDADGYFWYQARSDDMIVSSGYNIAGPEVEEVLLSHQLVAECGVVGLPDETRGQVVTAFVVLTEGGQPGPDLVAELQDLVKQKIAPYKYPRAIEFRVSLPRTNTGKLQRFKLRDQPPA
ncbi:MAG: AMP-binding protein [Nocardiopsaceae bacterium]|jgi:2-aminobenzoate-CoA ligase|nr:AMP-binding protein [Nocardiopsaceae bacterium]